MGSGQFDPISMEGQIDYRRRDSRRIGVLKAGYIYLKDSAFYLQIIFLQLRFSPVDMVVEGLDDENSTTDVFSDLSK